MKQASTLDQQIDLLKKRGMIFEDEEKAKEVLLDVGFYRLGFYLFSFERSFPELKNRTHELTEGTTFSSVVQLYHFDNELRYILMKYLNRIEVNVRTYITYLVSNSYPDSPIWFIDPNVIKNPDTKQFEASVYKTIRDNPIIKRHHKKYINDRFAPAWKTIEFMMFGGVCNLYFNLKDDKLKEEIAKRYGCNHASFFINYLHTIRNIRNTCAHGACLYNISLPQAIKSGPVGKLIDDKRHNIYGAIEVIKYIIGHISKDSKYDLERDIKELISNKHRNEDVNKIIHTCTELV